MSNGKVVATLKQGKGYDASWLVISGDNVDEVKAHLTDALGLEDDLTVGLSLAELTAYANEQFQNVGNVMAKLGAVPISESPSTPPSSGGEPKGDPWEGVKTKGAEPAEEAGDPILTDIAKANSVAVLRRVWAKHKAVWDDESHGAAVAARKAELEAA